MRFIIIALLSFYAAYANAQTNSDMIGTWKLVSFHDNELYFNLETDSSFLTQEMIETYPDTTDQKKLITQAKIIYGAFRLRFENDSTLSFLLDTMHMLKAQYKIDRKKGVFEMTTANSLGQYITDKHEFIFTDNLLTLSMNMEGELRSVGLRKQ